MSMDTKSIPAGAFKQGCLAILDRVANDHEEIVITKRGRPVARLVPVITDRERERELLDTLRGRGRIIASEKELIAPHTAEAGWDLGQDE